MNAFDEFEMDLREALSHLYDPLYEPPATLRAVTGTGQDQGPAAVQEVIIQAIEDLEPPLSVPQHAPVRRAYELLFYRYVQGLTQEVAAERLSISPRYLREQQWKAVRVLARHLWDRAQAGESPAGAGGREGEMAPPQTAEPEAAPRSWVSQVRQELMSLQRSAPDAVADVGAAMRDTARLARTLTREQGITLEVGSVQPDLVARIHPSALHQVLLAATGELAQGAPGTLTLSSERAGSCVRIAVTRCPARESRSYDLSLIREILAAHDGTVEVRTTDNGVSLALEMPAVSPAGMVTALVVDDNTDLVSFYRAYTAGSRYEVVHVLEGKRVFQAIEATKPEVIVLDVMLPDVDGWELLTQLHGHPDTRSIPVVVCSVIRDKELALALGAAVYVPKPVRRQDFLRALDEALSQAPRGAPRVAARNAAAC